MPATRRRLGSSLRRHSPALACALCLAGPAPALWAQAISLVPGTVNMFRDSRGANDVGNAAGERVQFGADIVGGSGGHALRAIYPTTGFQTGLGTCNPLAVNGNFCSNSTAYNASRLAPWTLRLSKGSNSLDVTGPSLLGTEQAVPFPVSVSISGAGLTPTISWQVPGGLAPDAFRVNVFDKNNRSATGAVNVIHSQQIAANATSFTLPGLMNGTNAPLAMGGNYTINLQVIETRGHVAFNSNNNALILRRSSSFFAFTPLSGVVPDDIALPTVNAAGVYNFHVAAVGPNSVTFIDPFVAVGYDYATGAGDPNFGSVRLPNVGDGQFTLSFTDANGAQTVSLAHGAQYFFGGAGVAAFRVAGIETSAMLNPADATAFITGLTFAAAGAFTGTMTPITAFVAEVPEPATALLWALGLGGLLPLLRGRRRPA